MAREKKSRCLGRCFRKEWKDNKSPIITGPVFLITIIIWMFFVALGTGTDLLCRSIGPKFSRNYKQEDYGYQPQNWWIDRDHRGIIYVANGGGVLEYDGVSWTRIAVPNHVVRSLTVDDTGTVYIGGKNEVGFLEPGPNGETKYQSLIGNLDKDKRNFKDVSDTHALKETIFFRTSRYLFAWNSQKRKMSVLLEAPKKKDGSYDDSLGFNASFTFKGRYYIKQRNTGLFELKNGSFSLIPGGEIFSQTGTIFMMVPHGSNGEEILIGTREYGCFIYDGKHIRSFPTDIDAVLKEEKAGHGIRLNHGTGDIAIGTFRGGLFIINDHGKLINHFSKSSGLPTNIVRHLFEDSEGNLWAALGNGLTKIEYASPLSLYSDHCGLTDLVLSVTRHNNAIYAGTMQGLFHLTSSEITFKPVQGMRTRCYSLLSTGNSLLAATTDGVFQITDENRQQITNTASYFILQSNWDPNRVWVGEKNGLTSLYLLKEESNSSWQREKKYGKITEEIRTIAEDNKGNLWLGPRISGVTMIRFPGNNPAKTNTSEKYEVHEYGNRSKLPDQAIQVFGCAGQIMFGTKEGLYRFDYDTETFRIDNTLDETFTSKLKDVYRIAGNRQKTVWIHALGHTYGLVPKWGGTYDIIDKPLARIPINAQVNCIYPDSISNGVWFATHKGLIHFSEITKKKFLDRLKVIIRKVCVNGDPTYYTPATTNIYQLTSTCRNLRIDAAAPFFEGEEYTRYRFRLEGRDDGWSNWEKEASSNYIDLGSGNYVLRVQALNIYGDESDEAVFRFRIPPPFYLSWWALLVYFLLLGLVAFFFAHWQAKEKEKRKLEREIAKRAEEIEEKNRQLESQTIMLKEQAEQLQELDHVKSRFFANISHEFRTPLTLITGPLEQILAGIPKGKTKDWLSMMHRNSHRLLMLINRLLDLSRIDSGKMKPVVSPNDIVAFIKGKMAEFRQAVKEKKLKLAFQAESEPIVFYYDGEKMEDILGNLVSNAVKFTPEGGNITISVKQIPEPEPDFPSGSVEIGVRDTGIGIPHDQLQYIFNRFHQVDSKKQKDKGSGIGLALTRELVHMHHGTIDVHSGQDENSWTHFILRFPLGKDHFEPDEILPSIEGHELTEEVHITVSDDVPESFPELVVQEAGTGSDDCPGDRSKHTKNTVLIVEDNPDMRRFIRESVESYYLVVEAADGAEGIQKAQTAVPDLVISDIMMPDVDGIELCRTLKQDIRTSHIPVILLTAKASESSVVEGLETGADDYITKPFNTRILTTRIKNLIDLRLQLQGKMQRQLLMQPDEIKISSIDRRFLEKLHKTIEDNLSDFDFNVEALSEKMEMSRVTLNKKIQAFAGETATHYIRSYRLKRAVQLLKENFGSITDVAMEAGFSSSAYFTKCFKEKFHQLPSAFLATRSE